MTHNSSSELIGKAYGFFDCRASKSEIEAELPTIRKLTRIPSEVDFSLYPIEDTDNLGWDSELTSISRDARNAGIKYALEAAYPGETNRKTAKEVAAVLINTYQSHLFDEGEPFRGEIVFEEKGKYITRD